MRATILLLSLGPLLLVAARSSNPQRATRTPDPAIAMASPPTPQPAAVAASTAAQVAPVQAPDLSGTWDFAAPPEDPLITGTFTLRRSGTRYSGELNISEEAPVLLSELRIRRDTVTMVFGSPDVGRYTFTAVVSADRREMSMTLPESPTVVFYARRRTRIRFARGDTSATVEDAVVRGTRDRYLLAGRAGQMMRVTITALEDNAVFQIAGPDGRQLPGAEEMRDATSWHGELPLTCDYVIVVGGTRGNATYRLTVSIVPR